MTASYISAGPLFSLYQSSSKGEETVKVPIQVSDFPCVLTRSCTLQFASFSLCPSLPLLHSLLSTVSPTVSSLSPFPPFESIPSKERRDLDPTVLEPPKTTEGVELGIRVDSETVAEWINGKAKQKTPIRTVEAVQKQMRGLVEQR